jgi:hypothetical protein
MGNKKTAQTGLPLQGKEEFRYAIPAFRIQTGYGLVADKVFGMRRQGACNKRPLPLAPGKFMRIAAGLIHIEPHLIKEFRYAAVFFFAGSPPEQGIKVVQRFGNGLPEGHPAVHGSGRILKNDLHLSAEFVQGIAAPETVIDTAVKLYRTPIAPFQATEQPGQGGFTAARFPRKSDGGSPLNLYA